MSDDETFEKVESGASQTVPIKIGDLKKGDYAMLKGKPCKVMEIAISKTGKHGHAKAAIVGIDIFTNNKIEDGGPTSHNIDSPNVDRKEYTLIDIASDDFCSFMEESGDLKEDLKLFPKGEDEVSCDFNSLIFFSSCDQKWSPQAPSIHQFAAFFPLLNISTQHT